MAKRTILGFDYGLRRIGVAVGQELTASARPLLTLGTLQGGPDWSKLQKIIDEWNPQLLVVGIGYHSDGSVNKVSTAALAFAEQLHERFQLPVDTIDERLSSAEAEQILLERGINPRKDKTALDRIAAALILDSWFNHQHGIGQRSA